MGRILFVLEGLGESLGVSWGVLGGVLGVLGGILGCLGGSWAPLGRLLGESWPVLNRHGSPRVNFVDPRAS